MDPSDTEIFLRQEVRRLIREQKFQYESVDQRAEPQPEVKKAVQRFRDMDPSERDTNILLYFLLGSGTPPYKMSKEDSQYSDTGGTQEEACANCTFLYQKVVTGEHICSQIRGEVKPGGWCNQWAPADFITESSDEG